MKNKIAVTIMFRDRKIRYKTLVENYHRTRFSRSEKIQ